jgi:uncharacterized protein YhaN
MRIRRIELRRFGRFTDHVVELPDESGLHVLMGRNEAGKTTVLDAITYTLHGMPAGNTKDATYGFEHPLPTLRTGLELVDDDGGSLHLVRKRGRTGTVLDPDTDVASAAAQSRLEGLLRGVDRDVWVARHGLTQQRLREGGRSLLASGGDAADALFAAATGITVVRRVLADVRARREAILADTGRKGALLEPLKAYEAAGRLVREHVAAIASWDDDVAARDALDADRVRRAGERAKLQAQVDQLEAARTALAGLVRREQLVGERDAIAVPTITWTRDDHDELARVTSRLRDDAAALAQLTARLEAARAALVELDVDESIIAVGDDVDALRERVATVRAARQELPNARAGALAATSGVETAARDAGLDELPRTTDEAIDADAVAASLAPAPARSALRTAADELGSLEHAVAEAVASLDAARDAAQEARDALAALDAPDAQQSQQLTTLLDEVGGIDVQAQRRAHAEAAQRRVQLEQRASALPGCSLDLAAARALSLPAAQDVDAITAQFATIEQRRVQQQKVLDDARTHLKRKRAELVSLAAGDDVPDRARLDELRGARDGAWQVVRDGVLDAAASDEARAAAAAAVPTVDAALRETDSYADELARDGERAGQVARLRNEIDADLEYERDSSAQLEQLAAEHDALVAGPWHELWACSGVEASTQAAMDAFVAEVESLRREARELDVAEAELTATRERIASTVMRLRALVTPNEAAQPVEAGAELDALEDAVTRARAIRERASRIATDHAARSEAKRASERSLEQARRADEQARVSLDAHRSGAWNAACTAVGIDAADTTIDVAIARCDALDALDAALAQLRGADAAVLATSDTIEAFTHDLAALVDGLGDAAALVEGLEPELAVARLSQAVGAAREQRAVRETRREQVAQLEADHAAATATHAEAMQLSAAIDERTGTDRAQLVEQDAAWVQRDAIEQQLAELDQELVVRTRMPVAELVQLRSDRSDAELAEQVAQLQVRVTELDAELGALQQRRDELVARIDAAARSQELAIARQDQANALATIEQLVAEHRSLALQEQLLADFVEAQMQGDMGPVVELASGYFRRMTCERFDGIRIAADDDGTLRIRADRPGAAASEAIDVDGMSEGTRDQLFLALRLATLVQALDSGAETMPLVVDDILLAFDDPRSRATLALLGELSQQMQVIFLTHHEHLVDLARDAVDPERLAVVELDVPRPGAA